MKRTSPSLIGHATSRLLPATLQNLLRNPFSAATSRSSMIPSANARTTKTKLCPSVSILPKNASAPDAPPAVWNIDDIRKTHRYAERAAKMVRSWQPDSSRLAAGRCSPDAPFLERIAHVHEAAPFVLSKRPSRVGVNRRPGFPGSWTGAPTACNASAASKPRSATAQCLPRRRSSPAVSDRRRRTAAIERRGAPRVDGKQSVQGRPRHPAPPLPAVVRDTGGAIVAAERRAVDQARIRRRRGQGSRDTPPAGTDRAQVCPQSGETNGRAARRSVARGIECPRHEAHCTRARAGGKPPSDGRVGKDFASHSSAMWKGGRHERSSIPGFALPNPAVFRVGALCGLAPRQRRSGVAANPGALAQRPTQRPRRLDQTWGR